jgi:hypothetical protein
MGYSIANMRDVSFILMRIGILAGMFAISGCHAKPQGLGSAPSCSVSPNMGTSSEAEFTVTCGDLPDYKRISEIGLLINSWADGSGACYVLYLPATKKLALVHDSGDGSFQQEIGNGKTLENSACSVITRQVTFIEKAKTLAVNFALRFKPAFAGVKNLYLVSQTEKGEVAMELSGVWRVQVK